MATARGDSAERVAVRLNLAPMGGGADLRLAGQVPAASKDYEFLTATSEAVTYLAMTWLLLRRLTSR
jgi:hypothetical protein